MPPGRLDSNALLCSFCRKSQDDVAKLIGTPNHPKAYICNECVMVCASILEDDHNDPPVTQRPESGPHPLLNHPLAAQFLQAVERWVRQEALDRDAAAEFAGMRRLARRIVVGPSNMEGL